MKWDEKLPCFDRHPNPNTRASTHAPPPQCLYVCDPLRCYRQQILKSPHFVKNSDSELQQRANEYVHLLQVQNNDVLVRCDSHTHTH